MARGRREGNFRGFNPKKGHREGGALSVVAASAGGGGGWGRCCACVEDRCGGGALLRMRRGALRPGGGGARMRRAALRHPAPVRTGPDRITADRSAAEGPPSESAFFAFKWKGGGRGIKVNANERFSLGGRGVWSGGYWGRGRWGIPLDARFLK